MNKPGVTRERLRSDRKQLTPSASVSILALLLLAGAALLGLIQPARPEVGGLDVPATDFSATRALGHIAALAVEPHPPGTPAHSRVRQYIVGQLRRLGLTPEIQQTTAVRLNANGWAVAGNVQNVFARWHGSAGGRAVLLSAHYDSVPEGPGAADDGSGTATLLETARALVAGPRLQNDVIFLFTDGEEMGLLGAQAFVSEQSQAKDIAVCLNFEARGSTGPTYLFETSAGNGQLIREFSRVVKYPAASSLFYEIYRILPNDTDLTIFRRAGLAGMNFAFIGKVRDYHTPEDSVQNLDVRSLQQMGLYALALARGFGDSRVNFQKTSNVVYFSLLWFPLWLYPAGWAVPLACAAAAIWLGAVIAAIRRKRTQAAAVIAGLLATPLAIAIGGAAAAGLFALIYAIHPSFRAFFAGEIYHDWPFLAAALFLAGGLSVFVLRRLIGRWSPFGVWLGCLLWASILHLALAVLAPGASYLFAWPDLVAAFCALVLAFANTLWVQSATEEPRLSPRGMLIWLAGGVLWPIFLGVLFRVLPEALALGAGTPLAILIALVACFEIPFITQVPQRKKPAGWVLLGTVCAGIVFALAAIGFAQNQWSAKQPLQTALFYGLDADRGQAYWATRQREPANAWFDAHFASHSRRGPLPAFALGRDVFTSAPAETAALPAPQAEVVSALTDSAGSTRRTIRVRSQRGAPNVALRAEEHSPGWQLISVNGKPIDGPKLQSGVPFRGVIVRGASASGDEIVIDSPTGIKTGFQILDWTSGLPDTLGSASTSPPELTKALEFDLYNWSTVVSKAFRPDLK